MKNTEPMNIKLFGRSVAIIVALLLTACGSNELSVTAEFSNTQDIDEGTIVYFEDKAIGEVVDTDKQDDGISVEIELEQSADTLVASNAAVVVNRLKEGAPLEIHNPNDVTTEFMQDGQQLKGLDSMFQLGAWMVGDIIQLGSDSLTGYVDAFQQYLEGEKFQQDKNTVQQQVSNATIEAQQAMQSIGEELDVVMQELAAKEDEAAQAMTELGEELAPVVQELAKSGSLLMEQLEAFTQSLEQTDMSEQQTGKAFLESLTETLEMLNESLEQGVDQAQEKGAVQGSE